MKATSFSVSNTLDLASSDGSDLSSERPPSSPQEKMARFKAQTPANIDETQPPIFDAGDEDSLAEGGGDEEDGEDQEPFMGAKVRRKASRRREYHGDYLDVPSRPCLMKILDKQGDKTILFADKILKFTGSGKMKRRILIITDFAIYLVDPETEVFKRRIALVAVDKLCLSKLSDNFLSIIISSEYDLLMASTRKTEIVKVMVDASKSEYNNHEVEVVLSNRFEYHASATLVKEVSFEEVEGSIKTRILRK